jgi:hypothetical protein
MPESSLYKASNIERQEFFLETEEKPKTPHRRILETRI